MGDSPLGRALDSAARYSPALTVRHDHALPALDEPLEHLVIGAMGVFTVRVARAGRLARHGQAAELRRDLRGVRAVLDGAGLGALPATGILCEPVADGRSLRFANGIGSGDITAVLDHLQLDAPYGPSVVRAAWIALDPPPFVADVRTEQPAQATRTAARPAAPATA